MAGEINHTTNEREVADPVTLLLGAAVRRAFEPGNGDTEGEQMWNGKWWRPKWGCDTLDHLIEAVHQHYTRAPNVPDQAAASNKISTP